MTGSAQILPAIRPGIAEPSPAGPHGSFWYAVGRLRSVQVCLSGFAAAEKCCGQANEAREDQDDPEHRRGAVSGFRHLGGGGSGCRSRLIDCSPGHRHRGPGRNHLKNGSANRNCRLFKSYKILKWFFLTDIKPSLCIFPSSFDSALRSRFR